MFVVDIYKQKLPSFLTSQSNTFVHISAMLSLSLM